MSSGGGGGRCVSSGKKQVFVLENGLRLIHIRTSGFPISLHNFKITLGILFKFQFLGLSQIFLEV